MYRCSACGKPIGRIDGLFICRRFNDVAERVPQVITPRKIKVRKPSQEMLGK